METIICDISAFLFWRTPPILRLLAAAPEDDPCLSRLICRDELLSLRTEMAERIPLCKKSLENGTMWRGSAEAARSIRDASMYLAPSLDFPVDVLVAERRHQHISSSTKTRLWTGGVPLGHKASISDELWVTSPAFTLQQLAARATLGRTVLLAAELCGSFSVYETPEPFRSLLERWAAVGGIPSYGGWSPCFDAKGNLTDLWTHEPLTTPNELLELAQKSESRRGRARLAAVAELVTAGAASPFEAKIGTLLGLPRRLGGEGYGGFVHNKRIQLPDFARALAQRDCCYGDLVWEDGLDLECQSAMYHDNSQSFLSDADRTAALEYLGMKVLPVTYEQIKCPVRLEALSRTIAQLRGISYRDKTPREAAASAALHSEILLDWTELPFV